MKKINGRLPHEKIEILNKINALAGEGYPLWYIANELGVHRSTLYRFQENMKKKEI